MLLLVSIVGMCCWVGDAADTVGCPAGFYSEIDGCVQCGENTYSAGERASSCTSCPENTISPAGSASVDACESEDTDAEYTEEVDEFLDESPEYTGSCPEGWYMHDGTCRECDAGTYSPGNSTDCYACPEGKTTTLGTASNESDCKWDWINKTDSQYVHLDFSKLGLQIKTKSPINNDIRISLALKSDKGDIGGLEWNASHIFIGQQDCVQSYIPFNSSTRMSDSIWTIYLLDNTLLVDWNDTRILKYKLESDVLEGCWDGPDQMFTADAFKFRAGRDYATYQYRMTEYYPDYLPTTVPPTITPVLYNGTKAPNFTLPEVKDVARFQLCQAAYFKTCAERSVAVNATIILKSVIRSIRLLNKLPSNGSIILTSDNQNTYHIRGYFADADLEDGIAQQGFYLEAQGGNTVVAIQYVQVSEVDDDDGTTTAASKADMNVTIPTTKEWNFVTEKPANGTIEPPTEFNITDQAEQVQELVSNNEILFTTDEQDNDSVSIAVWKPDFHGSSIPVEIVVAKATEYTDNRNETNVLGFMTFNGFMDYALTKMNIEKDSKGEESVNNINEEVMVEALKSYQKFNGFPETGEITENQASLLTADRCGNEDVSYSGEEETFICKEGKVEETEQDEGPDKPTHLVCPDPQDKFNLCAIYPTDLQLKEYKDFVWKNSYYFETDIEYGSRDKRKISHVGIAFNYNRINKTADYLYVKCNSYLQRLCFSYGKYENGRRVHRGWARHCFKFDEDQKILQQFKIRLSVKENNATFYVNGHRVFKFVPANPVKSSAFLFTLDGRHHDHQKVKVFMARICRRNTEHNKRKKRYALTPYKWYPNGKPITYSFVNYSTSLEEQETRLEVLRAIQVFATDGKFDFKEKSPLFSDTTQIAFMFIKGKHADGRSFNGKGPEKAHAFSPVHGEIHFNDYEKWSILDVGKEYVSLFAVALHELGHAFGLVHSELQEAVMQPGYEHDRAYAITKLDDDDIDALKSQYSQSWDGNVFTGTVYSENIIPGTTNTNYKPRLPTPKCCHTHIQAAFYFYSRFNQGDRIYIITNGFLWRYKADSWEGVEKGYPKRVAEIFLGAVGEIDAAFDTGKRIFIIQGDRVFKYLVNPDYESDDAIQFEEELTLKTAFDVSLSSDENVTSAFNHEKAKNCEKKGDICAKTTLIISPNKRYELSWNAFGRKLKSSDLKTKGKDVIGEKFPDTQFRAAFEYIRTKSDNSETLEVMQFDTSMTCRSRVPYPGASYKERTGHYNVPDLFEISGWCTATSICGKAET